MATAALALVACLTAPGDGLRQTAEARPRMPWVALFEEPGAAGQPPRRLGVDSRGLWALPEQAPPGLVAEAPFRVFAAARAADGSVLVGGGSPAERGWVGRLEPGAEQFTTRRLGGRVVESLAVHPVDPDRVVLGLADGRVLQTHDRDFAGFTPVTRHSGPCRAVAFGPRGELLATAGRDTEIHLLDLSSGDEQVLRDHSAGVEALCWSATPRQLASAALDGRVRIHDATGRLLASSPPREAAALFVAWTGPGGRFAATFADGACATVSSDPRHSYAVREPEPGAAGTLRAILPIPGLPGRLFLGDRVVEAP